jgi:hypothetical protein
LRSALVNFCTVDFRLSVCRFYFVLPENYLQQTNHNIELETLKDQVQELKGTVRTIQQDMQNNMTHLNETIATNNTVLKEAITAEINTEIKKEMAASSDTLTLLILSLKADLKTKNTNATRLINDINEKVDKQVVDTDILF